MCSQTNAGAYCRGLISDWLVASDNPCSSREYSRKVAARSTNAMTLTSKFPCSLFPFVALKNQYFPSPHTPYDGEMYLWVGHSHSRFLPHLQETCIAVHR